MRAAIHRACDQHENPPLTIRQNSSLKQDIGKLPTQMTSGCYTQRPQSAQEIVGVSSAGDGIDSDDLEFTLRHQFEASNEALQKRKIGVYNELN